MIELVQPAPDRSTGISPAIESLLDERKGGATRALVRRAGSAVLLLEHGSLDAGDRGAFVSFPDSDRRVELQRFQRQEKEYREVASRWG